MALACTIDWSWAGQLCWVEAHPGLAGWLQAVGSIAVLLWAVSEADRANKLRRGQYAATVATCVSALVAVRTFLESFCRDMDKQGLARPNPRDAAAVVVEGQVTRLPLEVLEEVPLSAMPTLMAMQQLVIARGTLRSLDGFLVAISKGTEPNTDLIRGSLRHLKKAEDEWEWQVWRLRHPILATLSDWRHQLFKVGRAPPDPGA